MINGSEENKFSFSIETYLLPSQSWRPIFCQNFQVIHCCKNWLSLLCNFLHSIFFNCSWYLRCVGIKGNLHSCCNVFFFLSLCLWMAFNCLHATEMAKITGKINSNSLLMAGYQIVAALLNLWATMCIPTASDSDSDPSLCLRFRTLLVTEFMVY